MTKHWTDPVPARVQIWMPEFDADHQLIRVSSIEARGFLNEFRVDHDIVEVASGDDRRTYQPGSKGIKLLMRGESDWRWRFTNHNGRRVAVAERRP